MNSGSYLPMKCAACDTAILDESFIWTGSGMYHNHCRPPGYVVAQSPAPLTADLLRIIVREEVGRLLKEHGLSVRAIGRNGGDGEVGNG